MGEKLTETDVNRLLSDPSAESRAALTPKVARQLDGAEITPEARKMVEDIVRRLSHDASDYVRATLAQNLKRSPHIPHDVALSLASDIESVSLPILEYSSALTDDDLLSLISTLSEASQSAVARRESLGDNVAAALLDQGSEKVAETLAGNDTARLSETVLGRVVEEYGQNPEICDILNRRPGLPAKVTEMLVARASDHLREFLVGRRALNDKVATDLVLNVHERAALSLTPGEGGQDRRHLIDHLKSAGRLSPSLLFRALCMGDTAFFETAMAVLADVPVHNVRILVYDDGDLAFRRLYGKARLPERLFPAFRRAVKLVKDTDMRSADFDRHTYSRMILERVLTQATDLHAEEAEYLLGRLLDIAPQETTRRAEQA